MDIGAGGLGPTENATEEVQAKVNQVRDAVNKRTGGNVLKYDAILYRAQLVAGTIYYVKVHVDAANYYHLKILQPLPYTKEAPSLMSLQEHKTLKDPVEYF